MSDPFAWDPNGTREAWFERTGPRHIKAITREGRIVMWTMMLGMAASIPLMLLLGFAEAHVALIVAVLVACFVGVPAWFFWQTWGRVKV